MSNNGLYVIGDENALLGFGLLGIEGQSVHSAAEAQAAFEGIRARDDVLVIFVTQACAHLLGEEINRIRITQPSPLIVEVPDSRPQADRPSLRVSIQQVLGVRLEH